MFQTRKRFLLTLFRLEEGQQEILRRLHELEQKAPPAQESDRWLRRGIDSILSYRAGGKEAEE